MATGAHFGWLPSAILMSVIHFRLNCWPFQNDAQLFFFLEIFDKMAAVGHFGCPKFTFDRISGHFRSIRIFFWKYFTKWPPVDILDVRKSLLIAFLIDRLFWMSEIHFRWHFWPFQIHTDFFFDKMAAGGHFGWDDNINYRTRPRYLDD